MGAFVELKTSFIPARKDEQKHMLNTEKYVEYVLCNLAKARQIERSFHKNYHLYLTTQRELLIDEIKNSLKKAGKKRQKGTFYRVVLSEYMDDPLCMKGSLLQSGRF